ncbi:MAG: YraN family protein [Planctomycetota bacterium]|nr:YraN family protein [Planctomycetota bacterium]MDA1214934.1 YraN family protein [Planctomycetota bacterium]
MKKWLRKLLGNEGEQYAANFLKTLGYRIIAQQVRTHFGEIDLIAMDGDVLVFVEVKTRRSNRAGMPEDAVTQAKQRHITRAALAWLKKHRALERRSRFDVVSLVWSDDHQPPDVRHLINAFAPEGSGNMYS